MGRIPPIEDVANDLNISRKRAERAFHCVRNDLSLESPLNVFGDQTLSHVLDAKNTDSDKLVLGRNQSELVNESLNSSLIERETHVIRAYFGLDGQERLTLGVTREGVRQIRNQALGKLRRFFRKRVPGGNCDDMF